MNHIIDFLQLQLDPEEKVKFSNTLIYKNCGGRFTQTEFFGMFSIKTHHFCRKNTKNSLEPVFWSHFLSLSDLPFFPWSWQSQFMKSIQTKIIFEVRKDQSQILDHNYGPKIW
jgi:hypothetical protein